MEKDSQVESIVAHLTEMYRDAGYSVAVENTADDKGCIGKVVKVYKGDVSVLTRLFNGASGVTVEIRPTEECQAKAAKQAFSRNIIRSGGVPFGSPVDFSIIGNLICGLLPKELSVRVGELSESLKHAIQEICPSVVTNAGKHLSLNGAELIA